MSYDDDRAQYEAEAAQAAEDDARAAESAAAEAEAEAQAEDFRAASEQEREASRNSPEPPDLHERVQEQLDAEARRLNAEAEAHAQREREAALPAAIAGPAPITACWERYAEVDFVANAGPLDNARRGFYAGAQAVLSMLAGAMEEDDETYEKLLEEILADVAHNVEELKL